MFPMIHACWTLMFVRQTALIIRMIIRMSTVSTENAAGAGEQRDDG